MTDQRPRTKALADRYMQADYQVHLHREEQNGELYWVAEIPDLPGCIADGESPEEALRSLDEAKRLWVEAAIEEARPVPVPFQTEGYSGRILLRVPKSLHRRLAGRARLEDTSMNQLMVLLLSESLAPRETYRVPANAAARRAAGPHAGRSSVARRRASVLK